MYNVGDEVFYHSIGCSNVKLCKVVKVKEIYKSRLTLHGTSSQYVQSYEYLIKTKYGRLIVAQEHNLI